jgi:hypothetical protein
MMTGKVAACAMRRPFSRLLFAFSQMESESLDAGRMIGSMSAAARTDFIKDNVASMYLCMRARALLTPNSATM